MTLYEMIVHHDFDELVPCFLSVDAESAQSRLGDLQQSINVLCEMIPGDAEGKAIVVSTQITTDKNNNKISRCLFASGCEDDSWDVCLAKEVIFGTAVGELRALPPAGLPLYSVRTKQRRALRKPPLTVFL